MKTVGLLIVLGAVVYGLMKVYDWWYWRKERD
jgi:hypothetical protein